MSSQEYKICVGDRVKVVINDNISFWANVEYVPVATGDSWILSDKGETYYINMFQLMFKPNEEQS